MNDKVETEMLRVLLMRPGECAEIVEIDDSLESMQSLVEGDIEEYMPFYDESDHRIGDCAIVCNEEGKMRGMELNRGIVDENGQLQDIIAGPFFICYAPIESEKFLSMPPDLEEKMRQKFEKPQHFYKNGNHISIETYDQKVAEKQRTQER